MQFARSTLAELTKIRTLPLAVASVVGVIVMGAVLTYALVHGGSPPNDALLRLVPLLQAGIVLVGILPITQEYSGRTIRTTLGAIPHRGTLLTTKSCAATMATGVTAAGAVAASWLAGVIARRDGALPSAAEWRLIGAAVLYLTLIGVLSHAVALIVRQFVPALAGMLAMVLIASPLLASASEHACWLPDRAAMLLLDSSGEGQLSPLTGTLVCIGWITFLILIGGLRLARTDA